MLETFENDMNCTPLCLLTVSVLLTHVLIYFVSSYVIDKRTPSVSTGRSYKCSLPGNRALLRLSDKSLAAIQISTFTFWKKS